MEGGEAEGQAVAERVGYDGRGRETGAKGSQKVVNGGRRKPITNVQPL